MALKFYTRLAKALKLKVSKFLGLLPTFAEVTGKKLIVLKKVRNRVNKKQLLVCANNGL